MTDLCHCLKVDSDLMLQVRHWERQISGTESFFDDHKFMSGHSKPDL